ncbi:MAG: prolipoprotein diacylglyceryl transferase [Candidatus Woesearchaeota archaeon]
MFVHNLNPIFLEIFGFQIRYYGLFYVISFIFTVVFLRWLIKKAKYDMNDEELLILSTFGYVGLLIGARLFYAVVYNINYYVSNPIKILAVNEGGLSFHGGLIGAVIGFYIFCRMYKKDFLKLTDMIIVLLSICVGLVKVGNFINGELIGRITTVPWAVKFPNAEGWRHPSQLYEATKNVVIFFILSYYSFFKNMPKGFITYLYLMLYPLFRFFIEFYRQPDPQVGFVIWSFSMGQILCVIMFFVGGFFMYRLMKKVIKEKIAEI